MEHLRDTHKIDKFTYFHLYLKKRYKFPKGKRTVLNVVK